MVGIVDFDRKRVAMKIFTNYLKLLALGLVLGVVGNLKGWIVERRGERVPEGINHFLVFLAETLGYSFGTTILLFLAYTLYLAHVHTEKKRSGTK